MQTQMQKALNEESSYFDRPKGNNCKSLIGMHFLQEIVF